MFRPLAALTLLLGLSLGVPAHADITGTHSYRVETFASGLEYPWGFDFLPDGRLLVGEQEGRLRIVDTTGVVGAPIKGVRRVTARGQGGLLGLAISPQFTEDRRIFYCHTERRNGGLGTSVSRATLIEGEARLQDVKIIFRQVPVKRTTRHFGCRLVFDRDGHLFVTMGDRGNRPESQNAGNHIGTVARITVDGAPAPGNPKIDGWLPQIWSIGHRNAQGAALDPQTGKLWTVEHGAKGGDEINQPEAGKNYGWPTISYGVHYSGRKIGVGTHKAGMEQPRYYWDPSIAPSGMTIYSGDVFPNWQGSIFVGALKGRHVARLVRKGGKVVHEEKMLRRIGERIRALRQGPDGLLYVLTSNDEGRVLRIVPE